MSISSSNLNLVVFSQCDQTPPRQHTIGGREGGKTSDLFSGLPPHNLDDASGIHLFLPKGVSSTRRLRKASVPPGCVCVCVCVWCRRDNVLSIHVSSLRWSWAGSGSQTYATTRCRRVRPHSRLFLRGGHVTAWHSVDQARSRRGCETVTWLMVRSRSPSTGQSYISSL